MLSDHLKGGGFDDGSAADGKVAYLRGGCLVAEDYLGLATWGGQDTGRVPAEKQEQQAKSNKELGTFPFLVSY